MLQPIFAVRLWVLLTCLRKFIIIWCLLVFSSPFIVVSVTQLFLASRNLLSWQMCRMWHYHICCGVLEKKECLFPLGERICSCSLLPCMLLGTLQMNICFLVIWICWVNDFSHSYFFFLLPCVFYQSVCLPVGDAVWKMPFCICLEGHTDPWKLNGKKNKQTKNILGLANFQSDAQISEKSKEI